MLQRFGKYRLLRPLHRGTVSETWLAKRRARGEGPQTVVLKRVVRKLPPEMSRSLLERAEVMAGTPAIRGCQNLVDIVDYGDVKGTPFVATRWVPGVDLGQLVARARSERRMMSQEMSALVLRDVTRGLAQLHLTRGRFGGLHLDISPGNIIVGFDGIARLSDALIDDALGGLVPKGEMPERYRYASPEIASGEVPSERSDIFSLGLVLYELLCGAHPYEGDSADEGALQAAAQRAEITAPRDLEGGGMGLDAQLEQALMRTLAREPDARMQSAEELAQTLSLFLHQAAAGVGEPQVATWVTSLMPEAASEAGKLSEEQPEAEAPVAEPEPAANPWAGVPDPEDHNREGRYFVRYRVDDLAPDLFAAGATAGGGGISGYAVSRSARMPLPSAENAGDAADHSGPTADDLARDDQALVRSRMRIPVIATVLLLVAGLGMLGLRWFGGGEADPTDTESSESPSLAIAPVSVIGDRPQPEGAVTGVGEPGASAAPASPKPSAKAKAAAPKKTKAPRKRPAAAPQASEAGDSGEVEDSALVRVDSSPPNAFVYVNDRFFGRTPVTLAGLTVGEGVGVRIEMQGYHPWKGEVVPTAGELVVDQVLVARDGSFGFLDLYSKPWGQVTVDGKPTGEETPLRNYRLPSGKHTIELLNPKLGQRARLEVEITPNERIRRNVVLK